MAHLHQCQHHGCGDAQQSGAIGSQVWLGGHRRDQRRQQGQRQQAEQRHKPHGEPPVAVGQPAPQQRTQHERNHDQEVPLAQGAGHLLRPAAVAHRCEGGSQHSPQGNSCQGATQQKHLRPRRGQGDQIASDRQEQRSGQDVPPSEAVAEKAEHQHGCRLGESADARRQGQRGTLHPQGTARLHQGDVGYAWIDHLQAGQYPQLGDCERAAVALHTPSEVAPFTSPPAWASEGAPHWRGGSAPTFLDAAATTPRVRWASSPHRAGRRNHPPAPAPADAP
jgi:hypothetical protein